MAEYVVTPETTVRPSGTELMEELHRQGFPVEIHVKGNAQLWESVRFLEPGPPEIQCVLSWDPGQKTYTASVSDSSPEGRDLLLYAVDALLQRVGGRADNSSTRERFTAGQFKALLKVHRASSDGRKDLLWVVFAWGVVGLAFLAYFSVAPGLHDLVLIVSVLSFLSAAGLTYSHFKS